MDFDVSLTFLLGSNIFKWFNYVFTNLKNVKLLMIQILKITLTISLLLIKNLKLYWTTIK